MSMGQPARKQSETSRAFAAQLRAERAAADMTQEELAKLIGMSRQHVVRIEKGERVLDTTQLGDVAAAFGMSVLEFVKRAEERLAAEFPGATPNNGHQVSGG